MQDSKLSSTRVHAGIPFVLHDLRETATYGIAPGFYFSIPLDEDGHYRGFDTDLRLTGPFDSEETALTSAAEWIDGVIYEQPEGRKAA